MEHHSDCSNVKLSYQVILNVSNSIIKGVQQICALFAVKELYRVAVKELYIFSCINIYSHIQ